MSDKINIEIGMAMKSDLKDPATKAAWMSEYESPNPRVCQNCGGTGYLHLFLASGGPFEGVPHGISKWDENLQKWWTGSTKSYPCPVCNSGSA